jgi:transcriptional regulator with XRE-family HTH domain
VTQPKMPEVGPVGRNVIANVERLRVERGLSWRKLSAEVEKAGRPIFPLGLSRFAKAERRTDVDEVTAFATVLGVTPDILMSPPEAAEAAVAVPPAALREARNLASRIEDLLEAADEPAAREFASGYVDRALRRVQIEVEELLDQAQRNLAR